ncbi:hypothetical protein WV31_15955 [Magnetospirillum sp. ME-1]|uniref:bacteriohemerythrin n=1 Tax=Magnetospirillum sp. ME-1 TaxID=1639348 RepID=UPI000A17E02D|nr:hemerythrin domain-containing protein [Magnetospirillum sp. ME-1]ARJ67055.1 hypothetical protein WV31_15955 [Magnetospirillum sp. ME-1]
MRLRWTDSMILGIPELDEAHRLLFMRLDAVAAAVEARLLEAAQIAFAEFEEANEQHFQFEEALFLKASSHEDDRHRATHSETRRIANNLKEAICDKGDFTAASKILGFLIPDLIIHLHQADATLARALQNSSVSA